MVSGAPLNGPEVFFTFKLLQSWKKAEGWGKGQTILTIPGGTEGQEPGPKGGMCTWHHDTGTRMGGRGDVYIMSAH